MKQYLPLVLLGIGAFFLFSGKRTKKESYYSVPAGLVPALPNGGTIAESQLPSYGFVNIPNVGWVHISQTQGTGPYAGQENDPNWLYTLSNMLQQGYTYFQILQGTGLIPAITRSVQAIQANFPSSVTVKIMIGNIDDQMSITPTTNKQQVSEDGKYGYSISATGGKSIIRLIQDSQIVQTSEIIWNTKQLVNFQASGIGSLCSMGGYLLKRGQPIGGEILAYCKHGTPNKFYQANNIKGYKELERMLGYDRKTLE